MYMSYTSVKCTTCRVSDCNSLFAYFCSPKEMKSSQMERVPISFKLTARYPLILYVCIRKFYNKQLSFCMVVSDSSLCTEFP